MSLIRKSYRTRDADVLKKEAYGFAYDPDHRINIMVRYDGEQGEDYLKGVHTPQGGVYENPMEDTGRVQVTEVIYTIFGIRILRVVVKVVNLPREEIN